MPSTFTYNYKPIDYATAQKQVAGQVDPLYNRAIAGVNQQKYANDQQAGQVAAARGLGHSGLAADQLNKIAIAAQGNIADLNAQRATQIAQQANDMVWRDKDYSLQNRSQLYSEWNNNRNYNYQVGRDKVTDNQWNQQFTYQKGRDAVADSQWGKQFNAQQKQNSIDNAWRKYQYSHMSASDKAQLDWAKKQYGEDAAWRLFELNQNNELQKSMSQAELDAYTNSGFNVDTKGGGWVPNLKDYTITSGYGMRADPITGKASGHRGIDIGVPKNTPIGSEVAGKVVSTTGDKSYGKTVVIQDANGYLHRYAHLNSINVRVGDDVGRGSLIGKSGNTGRVSGSGGGYHLHYEVTDSKGHLMDPTKWLKMKIKESTSSKSGGTYNNYWKTQKEAAKAPGFQSFMSGLNQGMKSGKIPAAWAKAIIEIAGRESTWNPNASNGTHFGYGQFTKANMKKYSKYGNYGNAADQIVMMYHYMKDRYKTPEKTLHYWDSKGWY